VGRKSAAWDFQLTHQQLEPGFTAIGKKDFVQLGEQTDLSSDLRITAATSRWDITRSLFLDSLVQTSHGNLGHDPFKPTVDYFAVANQLTWLAWERGSERLDDRGVVAR
jgi:hypothetical protein